MKSINDYIESINNSIEQIQNNKFDINNIKPEDLPSDFKLMFGNDAGNSKVLQFIFDTRLDHIIDNLLNKIMTGDISDLSKYEEIIKKVFNMLGIGENTLSGPVSELLIRNISNSVNSYKYVSTKNKIRKCLLILNNLKKQTQTIDNPEIKRKYKEAVRSLKEVLRFIAKVYNARKIITKRVRRGLNYAIHEDFIDEPLDFNFFED